MPETLITVENVSKKFCRSLKKSLWYGMQDLGNELIGRRHGGDGELRPDEFWAVKDVSFELKRGECLGLIGRNGAGKTTLLRMLNGLIKPDRGRIEIRGNVGGLIALGAGFNPILTGRENIYANAAVLGLSTRYIESKLDEIIEFAEISDFIDMPVQNYSSGMTVRLGFAVATTFAPDVLLLDEVLAVGDVAFRAKCYQRISEMFDKSAVILVSHNLEQVGQVCSDVYVMNYGVGVGFQDIAEGIAFYNDISLAPTRSSERVEHVSPKVKRIESSFPVAMNYADDFIAQLLLVLDVDCPITDVRLVMTGLDASTVIDCYTRAQSKRLHLVKGENRIALRIGSLCLKSGVYRIRIAVINRQNNEHLYWGDLPSEISIANAPEFGACNYLPIFSAELDR